MLIKNNRTKNNYTLKNSSIPKEAKLVRLNLNLSSAQIIAGSVRI